MEGLWLWMLNSDVETTRAQYNESDNGFRLLTNPLFLLVPLLSFRHDSSQDPVHSRLVARAFGLEPVQYFNIHAE